MPSFDALVIIVVAASRYVSLGSLIGAVVLPVALGVQEGALTPLVLVSFTVAAFVFWTHRENIGRLRRGQERRIGRTAGEKTT